jgi:hypothetical protein
LLGITGPGVKTTGMLLRTKRFLAMQHNHQG